MTTTLDELMVEVRTLRRELRYLQITVEASQRGPMAPPEDLSDKRIRFDPKREYVGPKFKGRLMSEATPEFLDAYARVLVFLAEQERKANKIFNGKQCYIYTLQDAARARRWALRKRTGWLPPEKPASPFAGFATDQPKDKENPFSKGGDDTFPFGANEDAEDEDDLF